MRTFLLVGHGGFFNRGCEALVRVTCSLLRERFGDVEVVLASLDYARDQAPGSALGLRVIPATSRWYHGRVVEGLSHMAGNLWPWGLALAPIQRLVGSVDAALSIGGDNFTTRRRWSFRCPWLHLGTNQVVYRAGRPSVIWGASIGPFPAGPAERLMLRHLGQADLITVRESVTEAYLADRGVCRAVRRVADPAFLLPAEPVDVSTFWPEGEGVLGLNLSPIAHRLRRTDFLPLVASLIRHAIEQRGLGVLLVPHVTGGPPGTDDRDAFRPLVESVGRPGRLMTMGQGFNAPQTKYVISQCRAFIGARTHSTIAAISGGVPTLSIAYSTKAVGINRDVFGHERHVFALPTGRAEDLETGLDVLIEEEKKIRAHLASVLPGMKALAHNGVDHLAALLKSGGDGVDG